MQGLARFGHAAKFHDVKRGRSWKIAAIASIVSLLPLAGWTAAAPAQAPICPEPDGEQPVYTACIPGGRFLVVPLLTSFAVDVLLKGDSAPVAREPRAILASVAGSETLEKNAALTDYLGRLEPLTFTRIDTATGTLCLDVADDERSFAATVIAGGAEHSVKIELPARLEGGYWRTPGVVQMAFWKGQRASFSLKSPGGLELAAEIDCIVVSADGIRLTTSDPSVPDVFVGFDACE